MSFDVEKFTSSPTVEELNLLRKSELLQLVQYYDLMADNFLSKTQIKEVIIKYLVDEEMISLMDVSDRITPTGGMTEEKILQLRRLEFEEREKE